MPDHGQALPVNVCLSVSKCDALLQAATLSIAMNQFTSLRTENVSNAVLDGFFAAMTTALVVTNPAFALAYAAGGLWTRNKLTNVKVVNTQMEAMKTEARRLHRIYRHTFLQCSDNGTQFRFLEEAREAGLRNWRAVQDRFAEAHRFNTEVTNLLSSAYDTTHRVKVCADVGTIILGAVVPLGWVANSLVGVGYGIGCKFAESLSECGSAAMVSFKAEDAANYASGTALNLAQELADNAAEKLYLAERREFVQIAQRKAEAVGERLTKRVGEIFAAELRAPTTPIEKAIARAGMGTLTDAQKGAILAPLAREAIEADKAVLAAQRAALSRGPLNGIEAVRTAPTAATKALGVTVRAGAIGVGLWFMREDIVKALEGATAYEARKAREARTANSAR